MAKLSYMQRTLKAQRELGRKVGIVERFNPHCGPHGIRQDLFGFLDVVALDLSLPGIVGVQACGQDFASHVRKLTEERASECVWWLLAGGTIELWGWRKLKSNRGRWTARRRDFTLADFDPELIEFIRGGDELGEMLE
jgi:hypothetical protein